jgi:membrane protein required for colicin V production
MRTWCLRESARVTAIDWIIVGGFGFSILLGVLRGVVRELVALAGWVVAVVLALKYAATIGAVLPLPVNWPALRIGLGALLIVIVIVFAAAIVGWIVRKLLEAAKLSAADRTLGAGFGVVRAGLVLLAAVFFTRGTALAEQPWWKASTLLPYAEATVRFAAPHLPNPFSNPLAVPPPAAPAAQPSSSS